MAIMNVNPTRMELSRLKKRLQVAVRGHKLLKDKRDEMMRQFIDLVKENKELRESVERDLIAAQKNFVMARAIMSPEMLEEAIMYPTRQVEIKAAKKNIMSVDVPSIEYEEKKQEDISPYPYSFASTSAELDDAIVTLSGILPRMLELAEKEKTCQMLADEIEKTRRRVNALEYVMIPQMQETIRYITMKLDENERGSRTRLMKVKDMVNERDA
ncbi:MAG: V-type ATP synthase subunit D [Xylanivirga thermophila]|jgi:V/A-type H+/Na+-transporting ATPase subunit D|uniref:V-type ATP synthase subunit D n=1 Tax=Xylanivirga thermophila TaxID=2496273 RepID=UPI00101E100A|nr:V-type ATP synthase subunit D [Xylanivirga thermophila]